MFHIHLPNKKKKQAIFDRIILLVAVIYPLCGLPQVIQIFRSGSEGVSIISWLGFMLCSALFLAYGLIHKVRPMIIANTLWVIIDGLVVAGIVLSAVTP